MTKNNLSQTLSRLTPCLALLAAPLSFPAQALEVEGYGSLRIGVEFVDPDNQPGNFDSYTALRDAYSRVGVKATHKLNQDWTLMGQLELPLDLVNLEIQSPYDDNDNMRIGKLQVNGPLGTLWYGRGWMAYYNYIAYPVDYFSSYYSGWATLTTFRREDTLYYATPRIQGVQAAFASTQDNGSLPDRRNQYVLSYARDGLNLALGRDDQGSGGYAINGISASYSAGPWYIAGKYEELDTTGSNDGRGAKNLLVQYALDSKNTLRGMIADVDAWSYGDNIYHLGWDHQYRDDLKFFAEYYSEQTTAAISDQRQSSFLGSASFNAPADSGGSALFLGLRYDFSGKLGSQ
ncbi:MAG: porin [Gammaproteobacteria bacterium SHHR-1]